MLLKMPSRFVAWLGAFSRERQKLWSPKDDLQDSASWSSPPLVLLRDIHNSLLFNYDCKDTAPPQSQPGTEDTVARSQQDGDAQQQEAGCFFLPQLNRLHEAYFVREEDASNVAAIPAQNRLTLENVATLSRSQAGLCGLAPCRTASLACAAARCRYG
jgi:hypothetical protein